MQTGAVESSSQPHLSHYAAECLHSTNHMRAGEYQAISAQHHNIANTPSTDEQAIAYHRFDPLSFRDQPASAAPLKWQRRMPQGNGVRAPTHNSDGMLAPVRPEVGSYVRPLRSRERHRTPQAWPSSSMKLELSSSRNFNHTRERNISKRFPQ